jgi:hypothetical protein
LNQKYTIQKFLVSLIFNSYNKWYIYVSLNVKCN